MEPGERLFGHGVVNDQAAVDTLLDRPEGNCPVVAVTGRFNPGLWPDLLLAVGERTAGCTAPISRI